MINRRFDFFLRRFIFENRRFVMQLFGKAFGKGDILASCRLSENKNGGKSPRS